MRNSLAVLLSVAVLTVWAPGLWVPAAVEIGAMACAAVALVSDAVGRRAVRPGRASLVLACIAAWCVLQQAAHWSSVNSATRQAALYWTAAACLAFLGRRVRLGETGGHSFPGMLLAIGGALCVVGVVQLYTSGGRIFWYFPSGYADRVAGPFVSPNHYAAFVELLLPIALFFGMRRRSLPCLAIASFLFASVFAVASRAGVGLALAEVAAALVMDAKRANRSRLRDAAVFLGSSAAFVCLVGWQGVWQRIHETQDPLHLRSAFLQSSLQMFRARPLRGFGLGTWASVYPQFASLDPGAAANHSHNEWAQWAAEGGAPVLLLMLVLFAMTARPAVRSRWGIGVIAVFLHSLVDYPFLRFGLAAWIFVLVGALDVGSDERTTRASFAEGKWRAAWIPVGAAAVALAVAAVQAGRIASADALYCRGTRPSLTEASRLMPDEAEYSFALAAVDDAHARGWLERAVAANPYFTKARLALAGELEDAGDLGAAEVQLLECARRDRLYAPAWALANFYFRRQDAGAFWPWARRSAAVAYGDRGPLFTLCFLVDSRVAAVRRSLGGGRPVDRALLIWLTRQRRFEDARPLAQEFGADPASVSILLDYVDAALGAGSLSAAAAAWEAVAPSWRPVAPDFAGRGFDWRAASAEFTLERRGESEVAVRLSGRQPEETPVMSRYLVVPPGGTYRWRFEYLTTGLPDSTGLSWTTEGTVCRPLTAAGIWTQSECEFRAPPPVRLLVLRYLRAPGTVRAEGSIRLRNLRLEPVISASRANISRALVR